MVTMIRFMVIAGPRSGTAWAANWLTHSNHICLHDPLFDHHYSDLDQMKIPGKAIGISCTGLSNFPDYVNAHPCPKVVLHRDPREINLSCSAIGLPAVDNVELPAMLNAIKTNALHVDWRDLFKNPKPIWEHLLDAWFDEHRHRFLKTLNVQAEFTNRTVNKVAVQKLLSEMRSAALGV